MIDELGEKDGRTMMPFMMCGHRTVVFAIVVVVVLVIGIRSRNFTGHRDPVTPDFKLVG